MYDTVLPSQIFSYYPKYEYLDNTLSISNRKKLKLYIDVKGCATSLFQEWAVKSIVNNSQYNQVDTSLFAAILQFIAYHKEYAIKRDIDLDMYFFMESGKSSYHYDIYKDYKANRKSSDLFGLDEKSKDLFFGVLDTNYTVLEKVVNKIPNCCFIRLKYLEADFVPYYLLNYGLSYVDINDSVHIIYSNDKDMYQCLTRPNIYQFCRSYKTVRMMTGDDIYQNWIHMDIKTDQPAAWFPIVLAIIGDSADGYSGVNRIGPAKVRDSFSEIQRMCGNSISEVYNNIRHKQPIFKCEPDSKCSSAVKIYKDQDLVIRNIKLASYQLICDAMEEGYPDYMGDRRKQIYQIINNDNKVTAGRILSEALNRAGLLGILDDRTINNLFLERKQLEGVMDS